MSHTNGDASRFDEITDDILATRRRFEHLCIQLDHQRYGSAYDFAQLENLMRDILAATQRHAVALENLVNVLVQRLPQLAPPPAPPPQRPPPQPSKVVKLKRKQ